MPQLNHLQIGNKSQSWLHVTCDICSCSCSGAHTQKGFTCDLALCCCHLEVCKTFCTKSLTFLLCTGPCKCCGCPPEEVASLLKILGQINALKVLVQNLAYRKHPIKSKLSWSVLVICSQNSLIRQNNWECDSWWCGFTFQVQTWRLRWNDATGSSTSGSVQQTLIHLFIYSENMCYALLPIVFGESKGSKIDWPVLTHVQLTTQNGGSCSETMSCSPRGHTLKNQEKPHPPRPWLRSRNPVSNFGHIPKPLGNSPVQGSCLSERGWNKRCLGPWWLVTAKPEQGLRACPSSSSGPHDEFFPFLCGTKSACKTLPLHCPSLSWGLPSIQT